LNQLTANAGVATQYAIHFDDAPTVYIQHNPGPADPTTRTLEQTMARLTAVNPYTGSTDNVMAAMADPVEESMLHMAIPGDGARTPSFTFFGDPDYFFQSSASATPVIGSGFAWNHGDIQPEIARTFIGIVGPGVQQLGATTAFFSDHVDVRPTLMFLVGLADDTRMTDGSFRKSSMGISCRKGSTTIRSWPKRWGKPTNRSTLRLARWRWPR
jgi:hypothetical protein